MPEKSSSQPKTLDDKLAEFADQVLNGQVSPLAGLDGEDEEMRTLAQTVMSLSEQFDSDQPDSEMAERIKARLLTEWHRTNPVVQTAAPNLRWWQKLLASRPSSYGQQQALTFALAVIIVVILVAVLLSPLSMDGTLPGTAEMGEGALIVALLLGAVLVGALFWFSRRRP
jgi:hypothetical protein